MSFTIKRLENEPIILITWNPCEGEFAQILKSSTKQVDALIHSGEQSIYRIDDLTHFGNINFSIIQIALLNTSQRAPGSPTDPRVHSILVGISPFLRLAAHAASLAKFGGSGSRVPLFDSVSEALRHARAQIALGR